MNATCSGEGRGMSSETKDVVVWFAVATGIGLLSLLLLLRGAG